MRIITLVCVGSLSLFASGAVFAPDAMAQNATPGTTDTKPNSVPLPDPEQDPAARSAKSIECAQKADAQGLHGKPRRRFVHECRSGA
jgi:hypothetical protein